MASISSPSKLDPYAATTLSFEDLAAKDGEQFGFRVGQPYARLGIAFQPATVTSMANLNSASKHVGVRSAVIYDPGMQNFLGWQFSPAQRGFGFYYRAAKTLKLNVRALDSALNVLEEASFPPGEGYAGILHASADIEAVQILAPHRTFDDANTARTFIDDLSFARSKKKPRIRIPRGLPSIILRAVRVDASRIIIGPGGIDPVPPWTGHLQQLLIAARILADAETLPDSPSRTNLTAAAQSMMETALSRLAKSRGRSS